MSSLTETGVGSNQHRLLLSVGFFFVVHPQGFYCLETYICLSQGILHLGAPLV